MSNQSPEASDRSPRFSPTLLRSPRETLGGYVILPRLIDKVRLDNLGLLPPEYRANLLRMPDPEGGLNPFDGRFLVFAGLDPAKLRAAILASATDREVLDWVDNHATPHTVTEKEDWRTSIELSPGSEARTERWKKHYPSLAHREDLGRLSPFDLIDLDEGKIR